MARKWKERLEPKEEEKEIEGIKRLK
jgi:hypothetical protein